MESKPSDETQTRANEAEAPPPLKSYTEPKLTRHGELPALSLGSSSVDDK